MAAVTASASPAETRLTDVVPEDAGVMRCICGFDHDDDFTIQCDKCKTWQHAVCVDIFDEKSIPEHYLCSRCGNREFDASIAAERQLKRLDKIRRQVRNRQEELAAERKKPGRKKRIKDEVDIPIDNPQVYFVQCKQNTYSSASQIWLENADLRGIRKFDTTPKRVMFQVVRRSLAFGLQGLCVLTQQSLGRDRFVVDFTGEICTLSEYISDPINQWSQLGCAKRGAFIIPGLPLVIDGRRHGSDAIFIRRSRTPNIRFGPVLVGDKLHIWGYTTESVKPGTELTVAWDWHPSHPLHLLRQGTPLDSLSEQDHKLVETASNIIGAPVSDCIPTKPSTFVDSENAPASPAIHSSPTALRRRIKKPTPRSRVLQDQFKDFMSGFLKTQAQPESMMAPSANVWEPAPELVLEPPKKKKLSLADYKRKFST